MICALILLTLYVALGLRAGAHITASGGHRAERGVVVNIDDNTARELLDVLYELRDVLAKSGDILGHTAEVLEVDDDDNGPAAPAAWDSFLDAHPELAPDPLTFTDDELVAAVAEAERQCLEYLTSLGNAAFWTKMRGAAAYAVADVIAGRPSIGMVKSPVPSPQLADKIRVGKALARLGREGRLLAANKPYEHKRWTLPEIVPESRKAATPDA